MYLFIYLFFTFGHVKRISVCNEY